MDRPWSSTLAVQGNDESGAGGNISPDPTALAQAPGEARWVSARWAWGAFAVLFLAHLLDSFDRWLLPVVLRDLSQELVLSDMQAGWLATLLLLSYAVWSPIVGYFADRLGRSRLLAVGIAVWSLACVGTGLARSYNQLQFVRVLVGIGGSTFGVVALTLLMDLFPRSVRARVVSLYYLAMPLGAALGLGVGAAVARAATWHTAFLMAGAPGLVLALIALGLPDPLRGMSEGVEPQRLRLHERIGPSRADYIDLMVNSSYTYSVFGLSFSMFAIGGLVFWLPTFLMVVHDLPASSVSSWLGVTVPAAMVLGMVIGGWLADRYARIAPRALFLVPGTAMLGSIPFLLLAVYSRNEAAIYLGVFTAIALMFTNAGPCYAIIANVVMPNMRAVAFAVAIAATHLLGDIWSPPLMGWVAETFGQADSMATPFGQALAALGALPMAQAGHDPENLVAGLLTAVPALLIAGVVLLAGAWHLPREMALMLAKLRAAPSLARAKQS
jgi:MFS transporter, Spinster family, sphingosine-1-phosphate transporter